jgi:Domain of unknown function (DUF4270)
MLTTNFMTGFYLKKRNNKHYGLRTGLIKSIFPLFTLLALTMASCDQDPMNIGIDLLPDEDFIAIRSTDSITIRAYTMYDEFSLSSDSTRMVAGGIYDEYFGSTYCDFVTQLRLMSAWPAKIFQIDSVFLTFMPSGISGDTAATHYLRLYETGTLLTDTTDFYSAQDPDTIKYLGEYQMPVLKADSTYSIRLHNWVGEHLLRDTAEFRPASNFYKTFFKGLYFGIVSPTNPVLMEMTAKEDPMGITIFYHDTADVKFSYSFVATDRAVNYNRFTHDRTTADPGKQILHVNDLVADTSAFLQTYHGVYVKLDLPSLEAFRAIDRIAVNKARIIAPVHIDDGNYLEKNMPRQIYVRYRNSEGEEQVVPDLIHDVSFMDGTYHTDKDSYQFNITTFVQQYLDGEIDTPSVELFFPLSAEQNVIFGANGNDPAFKFEFAYTIY